jgi:hypothetical protein
MAQQKTPPGKTAAAQARKPGLAIKFPMVYLALVGCIGFVSIPGAILLIGGTMPTVATWLGDRAPGKPFGVCVGLMNIGAVSLFLIRVVPYGHNFEKAMPIVGDGVTWLLIYLFAFLGWAIYLVMPALVQRCLANQIHKKVERLRNAQQELIAIWGKDVAVPLAGAKTLAD